MDPGRYKEPVETDTPEVSPGEVALLRLVAQRLLGPQPAGAAEAVGWMTALQAQDAPGVLTSVALRTAARSRPDVQAAMDAGEVVKSWPMRGTLHLVPARDLRWMLDLAAPRVIAGTTRRHRELGLDAATVDRAGELAVEALSGGRNLSRDDLLRTWTQQGLEATGSRGSHLLSTLAMRGLLCFGPAHADRQRVVLLEEWVPDPRRPERDEALGEWAERYFRSHGPATVQDLARWTGLTMADVRTGVALARSRLASVDVDGVEHLMDPQTPDLLAGCRRQAEVLLLPGFDEVLLGYADRTATLPAAYSERIVPGGNGMFRPTVVAGGQVVGTWRHTGPAARRTLEATPFTAFPPDVLAALPEAYAALP